MDLRTLERSCLGSNNKPCFLSGECSEKIFRILARNVLACRTLRYILNLFMASGMEQVQGQRQQQSLSPQMQQSLNILQAPIMEIRELIANELQHNPVLEEEVGASLPVPEESPVAKERSLDEAWELYHWPQNREQSKIATDRHQYLMNSLSRPEKLTDAMSRQLMFLNLEEGDRQIADSIIGNLGSNGFLEAELEEIAARFRVTPLQVEQVLEKLQEQLEPPGIAARNLAECLLLQLRRKGKGGSLEAAIVQHHLLDLARRKFQDIARKSGTTAEAVRKAAQRIAELEPHPARDFDAEEVLAIIPDILVQRGESGFEIFLNRDGIPGIRISDAYKDMLSGSETGKEDRDYLRGRLREGRFFLRSIEQRNETILAIATEIVEFQSDFFENGSSALKPLTMAQVAEKVGIHETTVSRAISGKYLSCEHGVFDLKYFFNAGFTMDSGQEVSNESVRQAIQELFREEDPQKPLSDESVVHLLKERGLHVARRTVAKYRDQLGILSSHLRRR